MAATNQMLPERFPCWCRAVYSWGGETKKDLGFVEGDLIECLNAGDGSWWMGRLHRDRRAVGLFPSNFVKVLEDNFRPMTRTSSPMPLSTSRGPSPSPQKSFRKPFQAYAATTPKSTPSASKNPSPMPSRQNSFLQNEHQQAPSRQNSHLEHGQQFAPSRQNSYMSDRQQHSPPRQNGYVQGHQQTFGNNAYTQNGQASPSRQNSLQQVGQVGGQAAISRHNSGRSSAAGSRTYIPYHPSRAPSPIPSQGQESSPPPPPPPPHRIAYDSGLRQTPSPRPMIYQGHDMSAGGNTPPPASPRDQGLTPSPLRDAMDDVMSSLQDMSLRREDPYQDNAAPSPLDPWSPDAFEEVRQSSKGNRAQRPQTSLGLGISDQQAYDQDGYDQQFDDDDMAPPAHVNDYMQKMEQRLRSMQDEPQYTKDFGGSQNGMHPQALIPGQISQNLRPHSSMDVRETTENKLRNRKSAFELSRETIGRTFTYKSTSSSATQSSGAPSSTSTQATGQSLMSGHSAGGFSATSAGSLARRKGGWGSVRRPRPRSALGLRKEEPPLEMDRGSAARTPQTVASGPSYHSSHETNVVQSLDWAGSVVETGTPLGGLAQTMHSPIKPKKSGGFLRKLVETAKTGAASARSSIAGGQEVPRSPVKSLLPTTTTLSSISHASSSAARDMGLGGAVGSHSVASGGSSAGRASSMEWVHVRRDVNRSNSLSRNEVAERVEKCQLMGRPALDPVDLLDDLTEGNELLDSSPVGEPTNFHALNLGLVDKAARFVTSLPPMTNSASLSQGYVCRPYRSDVQRLRSIFTWVAEKITWEEDFDESMYGDEAVSDTRRTIQTRRGCARDAAALVAEMCQAVGLHAEIVRGYLKPLGEPIPAAAALSAADIEAGVFAAAPPPRPNHWWNAVLCEGEWRVMDCSLASPSHPRRNDGSSNGPNTASSAAAESFYFLTRPLEACYTHIPSDPAQQHIVPPVAPGILLALPCALPPYFRNGLRLSEYNTALLYLEGLDLCQLRITTPSDTELVAEVVTRPFARDADGDRFESGELCTVRALAQPQWRHGVKTFVVKAAIPPDCASAAMLNVYAGKRGLMHGIRDNPHPLALSFPLLHTDPGDGTGGAGRGGGSTGNNPPFDFVLRHPTPHAMRHDLYVAQPQCRNLACNHTFVFSVRQHPSSLGGLSSCTSTSPRPISPGPFARPASALSMASSSAHSGGGSSMAGGGGGHIIESSSSQLQQQKSQKPAKLAIQAPSGKILRLNRKVEGGLLDEGGTWETIIKVGERGTWRGLVLADRSARWCVWGEWECV